MSIFEEILITLLYSQRAQKALIIGLVSFIVILLIGHHMSSSLHFDGPLAPMAQALRPIIEFRYEHAAWGSLITFWVLAGKMLIKDRKKYL